jgi:DNA repair exonuclease SbcCD ATPase subunit
MVIKRPSEKNTKSEILSAFDELLKEKKALEAQLIAKPPEPRSEPPRNGKTPPSPAPSPPALTTQQKMQSIIAGLNQLQLSFGGAVNDLSEKLTLEVFKLQEMRQAVAEETQQLESLHGLQTNNCSLATLIQQYEDSSKTFNEELRQHQATLNQEITQAKKAWIKEQEEHRRIVKERAETLTKTQRRDGEEYGYTLNLERKFSNDEYEQEKNRLYRDLEELQQTQQKQWAEREKAISDRETQFVDLKSKVEAIPKELEAAMKRAKEEGRGIANQQAKVKADLLAKEVEGQKRTYDLRIQALLETIQTQDTRIQNLSKQLDGALKQVQDLAVKAIEGSANISSFNAVKEIALEQAKNQNKVK